MQENVRVLVVQTDVVPLDPEANLRLYAERLKQAVPRERPHLVVLPELADIGYIQGRDKEFGRRYLEVAQTVPGPFTEGLAELARQHGIFLAAGVSERHPVIPGGVYNAVALFDPNGRLIHVARKIHPAGEEKHYFHPGREIEPVTTEIGRLGLMVCLDARFPETPRILSLKGAEILVCPFNVARQNPHIPDTIAFIACCRATENRNFFVGANRVGTQGRLIFSGNSAIAAPDGRLLARSHSEEPELLIADLERTVLMEQRAIYPYFRDRRPDLYGPIVDPL